MIKIKKLIVVLGLLIINLSLSFSQEELYLGGQIDVHTYPNSWIPDRLVQGEGKHIDFPLANFSANEIVRACKLYLVSGLGVEAVVWEDVVTIPAWDFIEITLSGCDNLVSTDPGNYSLLLLTEHSNNINDVNINSIFVPVVDGGSGAQNPHPIEIFDYGSFDSGCTEYYISFVSPSNSSIWTPGETYEITWEGNVDEQVDIVDMYIYGADNVYPVALGTENDGSVFYTVPNNFPKHDNYHLNLYSVDGPYLNIDSESFSVNDPPGTAIIQVTSITVPGQFQKGEPVNIEAVFYNSGNASFNGELFLAWHDADLNYLTDFDSYGNSIAPGESVTLSFSSSAIQSDVGSYFVVAKYYDPLINQYINLFEQSVNILGMSVDGVDLSDPNGTTNTVYTFEDTVNPESIAGVNLRSFIVIEDAVSGEIHIEEMLETTSKKNKSSQNFNLDYSFTTGNYDVSYVAFYDWSAQKSGTKTAIKNIGDLPWYCFWGLTAAFEIKEPDFVLIDMTNYTSQELPIADYNNFVFTLKIEKDIGVNTNDMLVEVRFYNTCSGEITTEEMYYLEAVDLWFLEKEFDQVCDYDYRFLLTYNTTEFSSPSPGYSALNIEVFPYFDVLPMNEEGIVDETQFLFYSQVYANNPSDAEIYLHIRKPDYTPTLVELNNDGNQYFYWINQFDLAGYYEYSFEALADNGQVFYSDTSMFFVGFDNNCDNIQIPGMVSRAIWCPGCNSNNPGNGMPSHIIVHDTEIDNIYALRESDMNDGSEDIRYHYLIDFEGTIYEGLDGGPNKSADHFNCMNGHTISLGFLGDFNVDIPSPEALKSFDLLLEYLCSEYQIDPNGIADHVFYDFENNDWGLNEDMPQVSLHSIVWFYPEFACDVASVGNCPGIYFPALEENILPWVQYCPENSQHTSIELGADIEIDVSGSEKSNYRAVSLSSEVVSLYTPVVINIRAVLVHAQDTLLIQKFNTIVVEDGVNTEVVFENNLYLEDDIYEAVVQYQTSDTSMWVSFSSELFENEITVDVGNIYIYTSEKVSNFFLFPNPCVNQINLNFSDGSRSTTSSHDKYLAIYNYSGQLVFSKTLEEKNKIDLSLLPGIYLLKIYEENYVFVEKLIVN